MHLQKIAEENWITLPQVLRELGLDATQAERTAMGAEARECWIRRTGIAPVKALADKTWQGGSHCHAHYPESFRPEIEAIIRVHQTFTSAQGDLFDDSEGQG